MTFKIALGALRRPIKLQPKDQGLRASSKRLEQWESNANQLLHLLMDGIMTQSEVAKASQRLVDQIGKYSTHI